MQDKWWKTEHCKERDETSTVWMGACKTSGGKRGTVRREMRHQQSGWRRRSMQDKWWKTEHCKERDETSTVWMEKTEHARQVVENGAL